MLKKSLIGSCVVMLLTSCAGSTPTKEQVEGYKIFDIKGVSSHGAIASNVKSAMQNHADKVVFKNNLPPNPLPDKPGRFEIVDPFANTSIAAFAKASGKSMKAPSCDDALITATSHDKFDGADNVTFFVCLLPYKEGYHLDIYYNYISVTGGYRAGDLIKSASDSIFGDNSKYIPEAISALEAAIKKSGGTVTVVDEYP